MRLSFRLKIALLTATLSALPLIAVGWLLIDVNAQEVESSSQALQLALVARAADEVEAQQSQAEQSLIAIAAALTDGTLDESLRLELALGLLERESNFNTVAIYGPEGRLIDRMRMADDTRNELHTPNQLTRAVRNECEGRSVTVGRIETFEEVPYALMFTSLQADGRTTGYAAASVSLESMQDLTEELSAQLASEDGAVVIVDGQWRLLAHPVRSRRGQRADGTAIARGGGQDGFALAPRSTELTGPDGRLWIATVVGIRDRPWTVIAQIPREVAYESLDQMRFIVLSTIGLTLAISLLAAFAFAQRITAPVRKLVAFAQDLAERRFDHRLEIKTGDELSLLGSAMSNAARDLATSDEQIRRDAAIRADLGRYLPAELVEKVIRREQSMELGGQRRSVTVMFADVVAFTPLSDRLEPEQVVTLLNELFTLLTEAVFRNGGTVDKFVGDCVMALFGAPQPYADHASRAICAGQDMLRFLESANRGWKDRFGVEISLAIGINTGDAVVGNVGSEKRMEYTAIGDVVNVAARLESIARPDQILVSSATLEAVEGGFDAQEVGEREVPGRAQPIRLYEIEW